VPKELHPLTILQDLRLPAAIPRVKTLKKMTTRREPIHRRCRLIFSDLKRYAEYAQRPNLRASYSLEKDNRRPNKNENEGSEAKTSRGGEDNVD